MAQTLVLIPTALERDRLNLPPRPDMTIACCGFGPVAAGVHATRRIAEHTPDRVLLVGLAGSFYTQALPVGSVACFESVTLDGVGAGQGDRFTPATAMNIDGVPPESLPLHCPDGVTPAGELLTVCAASGSNTHAEMRRQRYPHASAEDMEGYAVALAAKQYDTPVTILRGISNTAGDRDHANWAIDEALAEVSNAVAWLTG